MSKEETTPENYTLFQGYEWNVPPDGKHYDRLKGAMPSLKDIGITNVWLPPACKAANPEGVGFDIYDIYDLGEFEQKGAKRTKWGDKESLLALSKTAHEHGVGIYFDAVLNHRAGADHKEKCQVIEVDNNDRNKEVTDQYEITAWLGFDFPGRGDKYSAQKYHWYHFSGTDYDAGNDRTAIFRITGKDKQGWSNSVDDEGGNADYMMFADVDYSHPECVEDVKKWGAWVVKELGLSGFRLDAVQHFSRRFTDEWIGSTNDAAGKELFYVGEFWDGDAQKLADWMDEMGSKISLFDAPLLYKFASLGSQERADLRGVFDDTLVSKVPVHAVTVVQNHDTQRGQTVETPVDGWMKPLAHCLILLRREGYPCVFWGDLYGTKGEHAEEPSCGGQLPTMIAARRHFAYGEQDDYFNAANCIGFVRRGTKDRPDGLACVLSNAEPGEIQMHVGPEHKGEVWTDVLGWAQGEVTIDDEGNGVFQVPGTSAAIWVNRDSPVRKDKFPVQFNSDIYG